MSDPIRGDSGANSVKIAHEKYRQSGLGLMTTVIGLASGGIYALHQMLPPWIMLLLFAPIALALLQEMEQYRGGLHEARAENMKFLITNPETLRHLSPDAKVSIVTALQDLTTKANIDYNRADKLCFTTVVSFIVLGFASFGYFACCPRQSSSANGPISNPNHPLQPTAAGEERPIATAAERYR